MAFTPKQERFVQEYLVDLNAAAAARRAGYSEKTATQIANSNMAKPGIQAAIKAAMEARQARTQVTQDFVIEQLRKIAGAEASDETGSVLKYAGKLKALELLGKHLGMFTDKVEHAGGIQIELGKELEELAQ